MDTIQIGLIGAGWVAQNRHLPALKQIPGVAVRQVWSQHGENARKVAAQFDIPEVVSNWQEIAASSELDAVVVATPPNLHAPASIAALQSGKHVLCQGRMARNLQEARQMRQAAQASGLVAGLYPPRPGLKGDRVMRRLLQRENYVGLIREVRVTALTQPELKSEYQWQTDPDVVGVNTMALGMWAEVLNRWVGTAIQVAATGRAHYLQRKTKEGAWVASETPDTLAISARLANGATSTWHFSTSAAFGPGNAVEIYGTQGALVYQFFAEEMRGATSGAKQLEAIPVSAAEERLHSTDAEFIQAIREGTPVSPDFYDGMQYMEFCEAVALSLKTGKTVNLPMEKPMMQSWGRLLP